MEEKFHDSTRPFKRHGVWCVVKDDDDEVSGVETPSFGWDMLFDFFLGRVKKLPGKFFLFARIEWVKFGLTGWPFW